MKNDLKTMFCNDEKLNRYPCIYFILDKLNNNDFPILFLLSPRYVDKSEILKCLLIDHSNSTVPEDLLSSIHVLVDKISEEDLLSKISNPLDEVYLSQVFKYYSYNHAIPHRVLTYLEEYIKSNLGKTYIDFLINIFLCKYYTSDKNYENIDKSFHNCLEYLDSVSDISDYDKMICYFIFSVYVKKNSSFFSKNAEKYYKIAKDLALKLQDNITLFAIYSSYCYSCTSIEKFDTAIIYGNKALDLAFELDIPSLYFEAYKNLGIIYLNNGKYESALSNMSKASDLSKDLKIFSKLDSARLQNTIGYLLYITGDFYNSIKYYLKGFTLLCQVQQVSSLLDEAIKTFGNLSASYKMLGYYEKSIYFTSLAAKIIENITFENKIVDIYSLSKQYIEMGILYGFYLDEYENTVKYYSLAIKNCEEHYIDKANLYMINSYIYLKNNDITNSKLNFYEGNTLLQESGKKNVYAKNLQLMFLTYFSSKYDDQSLLMKADKISKDLNLTNHFEFYKAIYIYNHKPVITEDQNYSNYPFNLILKISEEKRVALLESKTTSHFELIQTFSNNINTMNTEDKLYEEALNVFNNYFLAKGFVTIKYNFNKSYSVNMKLSKESKLNEKTLENYLITFIENNNMFFKSYSKDFDIFNEDFLQFQSIKSMIFYYFYDEHSNSTYFYIIFNDIYCPWYFSNEDALTGMVLIKNLFLKMKNIQYTEEISSKTLIDNMTGLFNSKYMWLRLAEYIDNFSKSNVNFSMALFDIDKFKSINDNYGHSVGDEAIKFFAQILKMSMPTDCEIVRYGGDEFLVFFPNINKENALQNILYGKGLCEKYPLTINNTNIFLNFSFGIEDISKKYINKESFFEAIDKLMYINKKEHLNKIDYN